MLSIDRPVTIGGKEIAAGAYALLTIPGADFWTVLLNTDTSRIYGRADEYEVKNEVLRFNVTPEKAGRFYESLTLDLDIRQYNAELYIAWENTQIHFSILTHADSLAMSLLNDALQKNPDDTDLLGQATEYYLMNDKDPAAQLQMLNHALQVKKDRWLYRLKTDVCIRQKNYSEARKTAREAIAFLQETKPSEWERSVHTYEQQRKQWP
jgi:tetratricopeptide (TPR) repeat protein